MNRIHACRVRAERRKVDMARELAMLLTMETSVNVAELKNNLSKYLARVAAGETVVICNRNLPVAKVEGISKVKNRTKFGFDPRVKILGLIEGPIIPEEDWNTFRDDFDFLA